METIKHVYRWLRWNLAHLWLSLLPSVDCIGVAGSVGKTTTKELIASVLSTRVPVTKTPENWDPIFNIPITAFNLRPHHKFVVELGVDGVDQMDKYLSLVHPRIGVLTRLTLEHADTQHFGNLETAVNEELKLIENLPPYGWAVMNGDDMAQKANSKKTPAHVLLYGFGKHNDLVISNVRPNIHQNSCTTAFDVTYSTGIQAFEINLLGEGNVLNACAAIGVGILSGLSFESIQKGLLELIPIRGRLQPRWGKTGLIIDDTYNASPAAVKVAIDLLAQLDPQHGVLVLGDMLELGSYATKAHVEIGAYARDKGVRTLVTYGKLTPHAGREFVMGRGKYLHGESYEKIADFLLTDTTGSTILVKGSRGMKMDKVVQWLLD